MRVFLFLNLIMTSNFSQYISQKIDLNTHIMWFEKSNKYIVVNDLLNNLILNKIDSDKFPIKISLLKQNKINSKKLKHIKDDIKNLLEECNIEYDDTNSPMSFSIADEYTHYSKFRFNERVVKIEYSDERLKLLIDPKFVHLNCNENEETTFKIVEKNKKINLFKNDKFLGSWGSKKMHEFQGKVSMELTSFFHGMSNYDWTAVFHGSSLCKENIGLMLTGDSGSGKSSLSAILMTDNFALIADDFSPMDDKGIHYNFPSAISIKEGFYSEAKKLYKSFQELNEYYINDIKGNVKYLPDYSGKSILKSNCKTILNVKFGSGLKNEIKSINKGKALENILPDAWISSDIKDANAFINWVKSSSFYDLTYNDNNEAIKMINEIL